MGILPPRLGKRLAAAAGAVVVGDLIVGMAAFSIISLGALWYFCLGWIRLVGEFAGIGQDFGAPWQLGLAWFGALVAPASILVTVFLSASALRLPGRLYRFGRDGLGQPAGLRLARRRIASAGGLVPKR